MKNVLIIFIAVITVIYLVLSIRSTYVTKKKIVHAPIDGMYLISANIALAMFDEVIFYQIILNSLWLIFILLLQKQWIKNKNEKDESF